MSPPGWRVGAIPDPAILAEAAGWHERMLDQPTAAETARFMRWCEADPSHAAAIDAVARTRRAVAAQASNPALLALRREAVARAMSQPVRRWLDARAIATAFLGMAAVPLAAWAVATVVASRQPPAAVETFRTGVGERAEVTLADGSSVLLDTATTLKVRPGRKTRHVSLDGQGWFDIKPSAQPLTISAGGIDMVAGSGGFDIRTDHGGRVRAYAARGDLAFRGGDAGITIHSGRLLDVQGSRSIIGPLRRPATLTGWRTGMIEFDDVTLEDAVGELNRYRRRPIRIADARAASTRVSGMFEAAETPAFVDAVTRAFPIRILADNKGGVTVAAR